MVLTIELIHALLKNKIISVKLKDADRKFYIFRLSVRPSLSFKSVSANIQILKLIKILDTGTQCYSFGS